MPGTEPKIPLEQRIPPEPAGSPTQLRRAQDQKEIWYLPGWWETARLMGWRWVYFLPLAGILLLVACIPFEPPVLQSLAEFLIPAWKIVFLAIAIPIGMFIRSVKMIVRARKEPFCIHCGYALEGLPDDHNCPECGRHYRFAVMNEYRRDPHWFIQRYRQQKLMPRRDAPFDSGAVKRKRSRDGT